MLGFDSIGEAALAELRSGAALETIRADKWYRDLDVPPQTSLTQYAYAVAIIASGIIVDPYILTQPEAVTIDRWQQPLEQPYPVALRLETGSQQHVVYTQTYAIPIDRWQQPLSEPAAFRAQSLTALEVTSQPFYFAEPEPEEQDFRAWYAPLSEPRRVAFARGLDTGSQQALVYTHEFAIPIDRWQQPLSEPAAYRALSYRALQVTEQMFYTAEPQPEDLDFRSWYSPLSEPRLFAYERHLPIALYPSMFQFGQFTRNFNLLAERLHSIHDGTVQLAASHHGSVFLHGVPDGDLPESV